MDKMMGWWPLNIASFDTPPIEKKIPEKKAQLHMGSPEFKKPKPKDDNPLINKPEGLTKIRHRTKLSCSSREFVLSEPSTNENVSNNTSDKKPKRLAATLSTAAKDLKPEKVVMISEPKSEEKPTKAIENELLMKVAALNIKPTLLSTKSKPFMWKH